MAVHKTSINVAGKQLEIEIGRFAGQATQAVLARMGDTIVHATIVMGRINDNLDYFPLQVEYQEKLYAGGKIKGSRWVKRDGRPSDEVILKSRLIDRSIRPFFPEGFKNEVQIIVTVLSADEQNDPDIAAIFATSIGLSLSKIPWTGPIGAIRVGFDKTSKTYLFNPSYEERAKSDLDLVISASKDNIVMVEAGAQEVDESDMVGAFDQALKEISASLTELDGFIAEHSNPKVSFVPAVVNPDLVAMVKTDTKTKMTGFVKAWATLQPFDKEGTVNELFTKYEEKFSKKDIAAAFDVLMKKEARRQTVEDGLRPDGRKVEEIRPITCEVGLLPRTHGSAMFQRGSTQALTITTLGSPALNQLIESMIGEEEKRYIHHYNMPPFSVGEAGRVGWPSRREVGHGALAERALEPMIPSLDEFPYTIQVVSEIMSSNGSTSMASVCGSTLSLMDAGVPIKKPVSGIAMGLLSENDQYLVLSDIQGMEDHTGDMDFKVAGTKDGITAMQMDIKIGGIPMDVMVRALEQAKKGRMFILDKMLSALPAPRTQLSQYAPKIITVSVPVERIGEIIGPGGKMIKSIIRDTGAQVDINDEGQVFITSIDADAANKAKQWIEDLIRVVEPNQEYDGKIVRIEAYGAFVNILPGREGLVHVSNMSKDYVDDVNTLVKMGDTVHVRVLEVDPMGKIRLTMLTPEEEAGKGGSGGRPPRSGGGGFSGPRRDQGGRRPFNRR
jgi:polyribonucleotide nucleotidyltransferase